MGWFRTGHLDPQKPLGMGERLSYGMGDFSSNLIYASISSFLLIYYTNVVGVSAATVATVLVVSRFLDAVSDVIMGIFIDRTKSRFGRTRPWLLRFGLPLAACTVLVFSVPQGLGGMARICWMFLSYNLCMTVCYTALNVPYGSMISFVTGSSHERGVLSTVRLIFATGGAMLLNAVLLKLVRFCGDGTTYDQQGWTVAYILVAAVSLVGFAVCFLFTRERVVVPPQAQAKTLPALKALFSTRSWTVAALSQLIVSIFNAVYFGSTAYYCQYNLNNVDAYPAVSNALQLAALVVLIGIVPFLLRRLTKKKIFLIGTAIMAAGCLGAGLFAASAAAHAFWSAFRGIGYGLQASMCFSMVADGVEDCERRTGMHCAGLGMASSGFFIKGGSGVGTLLWSAIMTSGGFDAAQEVQSASSLTAIRLTFIGLPFLLCAVDFILMLFYRLKCVDPKENLG